MREYIGGGETMTDDEVRLLFMGIGFAAIFALIRAEIWLEDPRRCASQRRLQES
jgi:hypothetical protein